jgi:nucleoside-diphosphate-sugar epimerase
MRILVTGATGFVGKYVVNKLKNINSIEIIVTSTDQQKLEKYFSNNPNIKIISYNIYDQINNSLNLFDYFQKPDKLIHLAWKGLPNYGNPDHININLPADFLFLKNLISNGLKDITVSGTCFEYGNQEGKLNEDIYPNPLNYYSLAKDTLRRMLEIYKLSNPFQLKWTRLFYIYGKGQNSSSIIPQLENALERGETVFNMSGGEQIRDYLPVEDVATNLIDISIQNEIDGIINICSGIPCKVKDLVEEYLNKEKKNIKLNLGYYPYSKFEPMNFWGDNKKLNEIKSHKIKKNE